MEKDFFFLAGTAAYKELYNSNNTFFSRVD